MSVADVNAGEDDANSRALFSAGVVAAALVAGAVAFLAFLWLTAYAPDLRSGKDGGAHALSNGATGFRALGDLLEATGGRATRVRSKRGLRPGGLLVLTPTPATDPKLLARMVRAQRPWRTLIILPKWQTTPLPMGKAGWVANAGIAGANARLLGELTQATIANAASGGKRGYASSALIDAFPAPNGAQTIAGAEIEPLVLPPGGGALVGRFEEDETTVYVAADPDLFNTMGLRDPATARAVINLFDHMTPGADRAVTFDLTLNGFDGRSNIGKLMFEPPFLPATLCLLVAAALAAWGAFFPLGPAIREARALGFGKRALVDSSADLLVGSGREALVAERYVALTRDAAAAKLGWGPGASAEDVTARLNALGTSGGAGFGALADDVARARGRHAIAAALAALGRWKKERLA